MEHKEKSGILYIVATPIGNLGDVSLRALEVLKAADAIYCEDTRHSRKLCERYSISTPLHPYHEHNAEKQRPLMLRQLEDGKNLALISDAGTPLISDPGYKLVAEARESEIDIVPIPGACAAITALCAAGLPSDRFFFAGFLPPKEQARRNALHELAELPACTLIFYESPKRLAKMLTDAAQCLGGDREAVVARELTKQFETFRRDTLGALAKAYAQEDSPKGEIVVLIGAAKTKPAASEEDVDALLIEAMKRLPVKEAAAEVATRCHLPKRECYQRALLLKEGK